MTSSCWLFLDLFLTRASLLARRVEIPVGGKLHARRHLRSTAVVIVQNAAEKIAASYSSLRRIWYGNGRLPIESLMWTRRGVKVDVFAEHVGEMSLLQNQQVVKTVVSNGVHPPLSNGIGFRRSKRRLHDVGAC